MTNPIVSVQKGTITIGGGATSNTATITAVNAANSRVVWGDFTCTDAADNYGKILGSCTLTNGTTVTANRGTSDATITVTVHYTVIEYDSSALTSAVQAGSITLGSGITSNTATITSVSTSLAVAFYTGSTSNVAATDFLARDDCSCTLTNGTTVTAQRGLNPASTSIIYYCVVEYASANIQSIQAKTVTLTSVNASDTNTITSVTVNNTELAYQGITLSGTGINNATDEEYYLFLTNATTVTMTRGGTSTTSKTLYFTVLEYKAGVLNQAVQRGTIALTSVTSATATITPVSTAQAHPTFCGFAYPAAASLRGTQYSAVDLTNSTTVTAFINTSSATTNTLSYEVVEWGTGGAAAATTEYFTSPEEDEVRTDQWDEEEPTQLTITAFGSPVAAEAVLSSPEELEVFDNGIIPLGTEVDDDSWDWEPAFGSVVSPIPSTPEEEELRLDQADEDEPSWNWISAAGSPTSPILFTPEEDEARTDDSEPDEIHQQPIFKQSIEWHVAAEEDNWSFDLADDDDTSSEFILQSIVDTVEFLTSPEEDELRLDQSEEEEPTQVVITAFGSPILDAALSSSPEEDEVRLDQADEDEVALSVFSAPPAAANIEFIVNVEEEEIRLDQADEDEPSAQFTGSPSIEWFTATEEDELRTDQADEDEPSWMWMSEFGSPVAPIFASVEEDEVYLGRDEEDEPSAFVALPLSGIEWATSEEEPYTIEELLAEDVSVQIILPYSVLDFIQESREEEEIRLDQAEEDQYSNQLIIPDAPLDFVQGTPEEEELRLDQWEEEEPSWQCFLAGHVRHSAAYIVPAESRLLSVPFEDRDYIVPEDDRTLTIRMA